MNKVYYQCILLMTLIGCTTPAIRTQRVEKQLPLGILRFDAGSCKVFNASFENTSGRSTRTMYHYILMVDKKNNTAWTGEVNCEGTIAGGKSRCLVAPQFPPSTCEWAQFRVRQSEGAF